MAAQFEAICAAHLPKGSFTTWVNASRLGVAENPLSVQERAYAAGSTLNLHIEEDLRLAPDSLRLVDWFGRNRQPGWVALNLLAGCCGTTGYMSYPEHPDILTLTRSFNSVGFATDIDSWESVFHPIWSQCRRHRWLYPRNLGAIGWDWAVSGAIFEDTNLRVVQPVSARALHAGATGTHCDPHFQSAAFDGLALGTQTAKTYQLAAREALPRNIRSHFNSYEEATQLRARLEATRPGQIERRLKRMIAERFL